MSLANPLGLPSGSVTEKGYIRIYSGQYRKVYFHRAVVAELCKRFCYYPLSHNGLPEGFHIHHADFLGSHNCPSNLILLQEVIHNATAQKHKLNRPRWEREMDYEIKRERAKLPDWVNDEKTYEDEACVA